MTRLALGNALRSAQLCDPSAISAVVMRAAEVVDAMDAVIYLVDFAQTTLEPMPDHWAHADLPAGEDVGSTMAGRAFVDQVPVVADRGGEVRVWVPIVEGSDRTGVLALALPTISEEILSTCEELGLFVGYLIATHTRTTDVYNLRRRRRSLTLAASMQWDLLPPLVLKTDRVTVAGLIEPAYEVGGDCFDYALNGSLLDVAVFDPVGHGVESSLIAALCMGTYRHDRREARTLARIHGHLDAVIAKERPGCFATGQLARIDLETGTLSLTNAGHPLPLLVRSGSVVGEIECEPTVPWGLGDVAQRRDDPSVCQTELQPGDGILFYTDGVTEAHMPGGEQFGLERLIDVTTQHASDVLEPEEVVRRLVRALLEHQDDQLGDDATLLLVEWHGADGSRSARRDPGTGRRQHQPRRS